MARSSAPLPPKPANLSATQMQEAIPKIERRVSEIQAFDPDSVRDRSDPRISSMEKKLEALLESVFPSGTIEHNRYSFDATNLDRAGINIYGTPHHEVIEGLHRGREAVIHHWTAIVEQFKEELSDKGLTSAGKAIRAYQGLDLHPDIERAAGQLYRDGHYANAIVDAVKALNNLVRLRSGEEKDGTSLMEYVFGPKTPILKFNNLADQSDVDEQKGFMMMFSGAVAGLRNPRAHKFIKDDPERALEFIAYISLLAKLLDEANK